MQQSRIENAIDEIIEFIDGSSEKVFFSTDLVKINKYDLIDMIEKLKDMIPDEIEAARQLKARSDAILADAKKTKDEAQQEADLIIEKANQYTDSIVNEHSIMQQAYDQANQVVAQATDQAQEILDNAAAQADGMMKSINDYMDQRLADLEELLNSAITTNQQRHDYLIKNMQEHLTVVVANRAELAGMNQPQAASQEAAAAAADTNIDML